MNVNGEHDRPESRSHRKSISISYVDCYFVAPAGQEFLVEFTLNNIEAFITALERNGRMPLVTHQMFNAQIGAISKLKKLTIWFGTQ